jgi:hypothetical protein
MDLGRWNCASCATRKREAELWRFPLHFQKAFYSGTSLLLLCLLSSFPGPFADSWSFSVAALPSADALRPATPVAALLNASGSKDSHRGHQQSCAAFRGTPENVGQQQGLRQASGSIYWCETGKQPDEGSVVTSRDTVAAESEVHLSGHTHRKSTRIKEMSAAQQAWGRGRNRERQEML